MISSLRSLPTWVLSSAAGRAHQILHRRLAHAGFTGYEYRCVSSLTEAQPLSQTELGVAAALDARDVTHTVRALEDRGLVSRTRDASHGRRQLVSLTPGGVDAGIRLAEVMSAVQVEVFGGLSDEDRSRLLELLDRIGRE